MRRNMYESIQARVDAIISFILFQYKNKLRGISRLYLPETEIRNWGRTLRKKIERKRTTQAFGEN